MERRGDVSNFPTRAHGLSSWGVGTRVALGQRMHRDGWLRALRLGPRALGDHELVAMVAGQAVDVSPRELVVEPVDRLLERSATSVSQLVRLVCAVELGRRALQSVERRPRLATADAIVAALRPELAGLQHEEFHVLCLSVRNVVLRHARVAQGSVDQCPVDPREVFAPAVVSRASAVVLVHNHPSGDPTPSALDLALTHRLVTAGELLGIRVVDHLILGQPGFVSFAQHGFLQPGRAPVVLRVNG